MLKLRRMEAADEVSHSTTQDERTMAVLAHVLQIVGSWIAPLVIFLLRPNSKFVRFHALQALLLQLLFLLFWGCVMVAYLAFLLAFAGRIQHGSKEVSDFAPAVFLVIWSTVLFGWGFWILGLLAAILYSIKAGRGEWANYPLLGPLARRFLGLPQWIAPQPAPSGLSAGPS
ncbi:MAG TPA: DUF4870 domain-containing protein [Terriglobales bacterium]|nr:DUF4870 domain-containing protein [Terriglobales bacterium]